VRERAFTGCSNSKWPVGNTCPLNASSSSEYRRVVAMYRSPRAWQRSAFFYFKRPTPPANATTAEICEFVSRKLWAGMQTGLTMGWDPARVAANGSRPVLDANAACWRLNNFAWVGITDYWRSSICLFHARFGGEAAESDYANIRPGAASGSSGSSGSCPDAVDEQTFACAFGRFLRELRPHPRCLRLLAADAAGADIGYAAADAMLREALS
jgi:hypothetical protein